VMSLLYYLLLSSSWITQDVLIQISCELMNYCLNSQVVDVISDYSDIR